MNIKTLNYLYKLFTINYDVSFNKVKQNELKKWYTLTAACAVVLIMCLTLLVLSSWIISSAFPGTSVHSLLSSEGVRLFFGRFVGHAASWPLVWLLLLTIAWGVFRSSGLGEILGNCSRNDRRLLSRQRFALTLSVVELVLILVVMILLTLVPHAILLGSTGTLFPSPFSRSFVAVLSFTVIVCSLTYGLASRQLTSLSDVMSALVSGFSSVIPLFVLYLLAVQLYYGILFVFFS